MVPIATKNSPPVAQLYIYMYSGEFFVAIGTLFFAFFLIGILSLFPI